MLLVGIQNGSLQRSKMTNALTFDPAILPLGMYLTVLNGIQIESFIITLSLRAEDWEQSVVINQYRIGSRNWCILTMEY